jgi:hypothetical protein
MVFTYGSAGRLFNDEAHDVASDVYQKVGVVRGQVANPSVNLGDQFWNRKYN